MDPGVVAVRIGVRHGEGCGNRTGGMLSISILLKHLSTNGPNTHVGGAFCIVEHGHVITSIRFTPERRVKNT